MVYRVEKAKVDAAVAAAYFSTLATNGVPP